MTLALFGVALSQETLATLQIETFEAWCVNIRGLAEEVALKKIVEFATEKRTLAVEFARLFSFREHGGQCTGPGDFTQRLSCHR